MLSTSRAMIVIRIDERLSELPTPKRRRTRSLLTGFQFGGIKLKGCSAGGWSSGMRLSEK
jgi:hypothetical protein